MQTPDYWAGALKAAGLQPSYNRICILRYLDENRVHPDAEEIFSALHPTLPSLSRTTVYNTLRALVECGLARDVRIEEGSVRYDADTAEHGHFKCEKCGCVTDIYLDGIAWPVPTGASVTQRDFFVRGICGSCSEKN